MQGKKIANLEKSQSEKKIKSIKVLHSCSHADRPKFCASAITMGIMEEKEKNHWKLSVEYKREMKQFGDYV